MVLRNDSTQQIKSLERIMLQVEMRLSEMMYNAKGAELCVHVMFPKPCAEPYSHVISGCYKVAAAGTEAQHAQPHVCDVR